MAVRTIGTLDSERGVDGAAVAARVAETMHELLGLPSAVLRPERVATGWGLEFMAWPGFPASFGERYAAVLSQSPTGFFAYEPLRPAAADRNVLRDGVPTAPRVSSARAFFEAYRLADRIQTRMLVCEGPLLLAWLGALRHRGADDVRERHIIGRIARAARRPLRFARGLNGSLTYATLEAAFEAYAGEIYLVRRDGGVERTNECGACMLSRDTAGLLAEIRASLDPLQRPAAFTVLPVRSRGLRELFILTRPARSGVALDARISAARVRWNLSPRQAEVLGRLALGDANKDIASRLVMGVRTVEQHVATILQRARADNRLRLIAKLWTM